jgi:hypothetical protein
MMLAFILRLLKLRDLYLAVNDKQIHSVWSYVAFNEILCQRSHSNRSIPSHVRMLLEDHDLLVNHSEVAQCAFFNPSNLLLLHVLGTNDLGSEIFLQRPQCCFP